MSQGADVCVVRVDDGRAVELGYRNDLPIHLDLLIVAFGTPTLIPCIKSLACHGGGLQRFQNVEWSQHDGTRFAHSLNELRCDLRLDSHNGLGERGGRYDQLRLRGLHRRYQMVDPGLCIQNDLPPNAGLNLFGRGNGNQQRCGVESGGQFGLPRISIASAQRLSPLHAPSPRARRSAKTSLIGVWSRTSKWLITNLWRDQ